MYIERIERGSNRKGVKDTVASGVLGRDPSEHLPMVWLRGQPHLEDYLRFCSNRVIGGDKLDLRKLTAEWSRSNDYYYELEQREAGIADTIECRPLDKRLARQARVLEENPWFRSSFDNLPYTIELVELDKLVVSQIQVESGFSHAIAARLGQSPTPSQLFEFCLPVKRDMPPVEIRRLASDRYQFISPSSDMREHEPMLLRGKDIAHLDFSGPVAAMFAIPVGFGSNFLSAVRSGKRTLLQNGYHRSYALRSAGFTHAWCVVEHVTRKDELRLTANGTVSGDPEFYFASKRPPILRDFFDPTIAREFMTRPVECCVEVEIKVRDTSSTRV